MNLENSSKSIVPPTSLSMSLNNSFGFALSLRAKGLSSCGVSAPDLSLSNALNIAKRLSSERTVEGTPVALRRALGTVFCVFGLGVAFGVPDHQALTLLQVGAGAGVG